MFLGFNNEIDDRELEDELARLEQEEIAERYTKVELPTVPISTYSQPAAVPSTKAKKDQLAELTEWAS